MVIRLLLLCTIGDIMFAQKVLLISMDGFRWDYIKNASTPNFDQMARDGSRARYIHNTFATLTFPSHYSIVTGLYEESHGIVENKMYDPETGEFLAMAPHDIKWWDEGRHKYANGLHEESHEMFENKIYNPEVDQYFTIASKNTEWWYEGEPIWVTARKQNLKSAVYFWPGSETEIKGYRPNIWMKYDESTPFLDRVETMIGWLSNSINLGLLYFHEPDNTAHAFGVYSKELIDKVEELDGLLGSVIQKLDKAGLTDSVHVIVTSDHGMTDIDQNTRTIDLSKYIDLSAIKASTQKVGPVINILPQQGQLNEMYNNLTMVPHMQVFFKEDIPDRWHYRNNRRILPLLLVADEGWIINQKATKFILDETATHGYDNQLLSMKSIFYAKGPHIRKNLVVEPFNSVDIYSFICSLLGISPAPNNGTMTIVQLMLDETISLDPR